ncbi:RNA polymerase sigma factor [Granulicella sp. S156]|jgi:RNA polymerase sigma-70 factor (ECF subfamily)|uniref:RNA polymerase sigma factor n=1 Tax=Granulicella sp. S156 TaxID=1747224 RepID=UPI00131B3E24|nr:sigma-70 family RNA polymerase sigma factor [Granulicella sp. S156]
MRADLSSPENFEALVREHQGLVFRTLTRMTGGGPHVEDLAQEAFLRLYRALPDFRGDATISTYLYRIVVNLSQDEWKRRRKERTYLASEPASLEGEEESAAWIENFAGDDLAGEHARTPEQRLSDAELQSAVDAELLALPEIERSVLVLYHQEECSYEGIAVALGLPLNTVRTHLHRGRKRLSERLRSRFAAQPHPNESSSNSPSTRAIMAGKA